MWTPPVVLRAKRADTLASLVGHSMMADSGFANSYTIVLGVYHHMTLKHETNLWMLALLEVEEVSKSPPTPILAVFMKGSHLTC